MLTVRQLFFNRLFAYWKYQIGVIRVVVDWIVMLYIIVPALAFAGYQYHFLWLTSPEWMTNVPFIAVLIVLRLTAIGTVRLFVEDGDQLFMLQRVKWFRTLMKRGLYYAIIVHTLITAVVVLLITPILRLRYDLTLEQIVILGIFMCCFRLSAAMAVHIMSARYSGWRYGFRIVLVQLLISVFFVLVLLKLIAQPIILAVICGFLWVSFIYMMQYRLKLKGTFFHDVEHERKQKLKIVSILLIGRVRGKPRVNRRQPLLFRKSKLLFKVRTPANGLAEICIKTFFRDSTRVTAYSVLVILSMALIGFDLFPTGLKQFLWLTLAFLFTIWVKRYWREVAASPFVKMFPWKDEVKATAARQALFYMVMPGFLLISAAFGLGAYPLVEGIFMIPIGWLIAFTVSRIMVPF